VRGVGTTAARPGRLRVVMLINKLNPGGGAERAMVGLATHLPRDRFQVVVATTRRDKGPLLDSILAEGIPHLALDRRSRLDVVPFRRLVAFLRGERIDVVHAHMFGSNLWASIFGRLAGVPAVIAHEQTWSYEGDPVRRFLDGHVIGRLADAFVAVSERDRDRMIDLEGVPAEKIVLIPNPYVPRPDVRPVDVRRQLGLAADAPVVATVAVLRPQKALHVLLEAFAQLSSSLPDARLVIGGDGECREALEHRAGELGLAKRVHFLGWWHDVGGLLEAAEVAAMSSDYEGSPLFALECMAHGTPLVSTDVGNVGSLLGDGRGVVIVPRRDPSALAGAIASLLRDPARRAAQAAAAAKRLPRYQIANVAAEFGELYERLVAQAEMRRSPRTAAPHNGAV
jgi:glycosyltransferase involved in cell wall biosynthesis